MPHVVVQHRLASEHPLCLFHCSTMMERLMEHPDWLRTRVPRAFPGSGGFVFHCSGYTHIY